jgi:hypothetical protein
MAVRIFSSAFCHARYSCHASSVQAVFMPLLNLFSPVQPTRALSTRFLDGSQQASSVGWTLQEVNGLHEAFVVIFRHQNDATSIPASYKKRRAIVAHFVHVRRQIVAKLTIRNTCHRTLHPTSSFYRKMYNVQIIVQRAKKASVVLLHRVQVQRCENGKVMQASSCKLMLDKGGDCAAGAPQPAVLTAATLVMQL